MKFKKRHPLRPSLLRRKERRRLKKFSVGRLVPNTITMASLCVSLSGVRFALEGRLEQAVTCILLAAIFDSLDGRLARLLKCSSYFGAELDSLADIISFGVSPALILYSAVLHKLGGLGWSSCLFFCVCCSLRLARFNTTSSNPVPFPWVVHFFVGVPAPAGALIALSPLIFSFCSVDLWIMSPMSVVFIVVTAGILEISKLPTFSLKKIALPQRYVLPLLVLTSFVVICLVTAVWNTLSILTIGYLLSIPCSYVVHTRLQRRHNAMVTKNSVS
jgi:CDP-diacylglycerol--serine O-phosphatidyltransferase